MLRAMIYAQVHETKYLIGMRPREGLHVSTRQFPLTTAWSQPQQSVEEPPRVGASRRFREEHMKALSM